MVPSELGAGSMPDTTAPKNPTDDIDYWTRIGVLIIIATFGVAITWSSLAPLSSAVIASGIVKVDSNRKKIQHLEGGVVQEILVRDGDEVEADQVLIRLDKTRADASHGVLKVGYDAAIAQQARFIAERDELPFVVPPELLARKDDPSVAEVIESQVSLYKARRASLDGQLSIIDKQIVFLQKGIDGLLAQQRAKEEQLKSQNAELDGLKALLEKGMVEHTRLRGVEREISRLEGERAEHISDIAKSRANISEKELEKFQLRKNFREQVSEELRKVQAETHDLSERINAAQHTLEKTEIRAPVDGTVVELKTYTSGGVISPGEVLMEIVPANDRLIVEAKASPADMDRLQVGLATAVKIIAFNQRSTPELNGTLQYISADVIEDPKSGMAYFLLKIEIPGSEIQRLDGKKLQPGMTADVFVRTGERTFFGYLFDPIVQSLNKAWRER